MFILSSFIITFIVACTYYYKGSKLVIISNVFLMVSYTCLLNFFNDITCLCDTALVMGFFLNIFFISYNKNNSSLYSKFSAVVSFLNLILLFIYFIAMIYDLTLGFSLDVESSPIKWLVDFANEYLITTVNCESNPKSGGIVDNTIDKLNDTSKSIDSFSKSIRPYIKAVTVGSAVVTVSKTGPIIKSAPIQVKVGLVITGAGWGFLSGGK